MEIQEIRKFAIHEAVSLYEYLTNLKLKYTTNGTISSIEVIQIAKEIEDYIINGLETNSENKNE